MITPFLWNFVSDVSASNYATAGRESGSIKEERKDGYVTITFDDEHN